MLRLYSHSIKYLIFSYFRSDASSGLLFLFYHLRYVPYFRRQLCKYSSSKMWIFRRLYTNLALRWCKNWCIWFTLRLAQHLLTI